MRSGVLTVVVIACVLIGLTIALRAHQQGNFHKLKIKANIDTEHRDARVPLPGGQEPIVLLRSQMAGDTTPQFLSATLLPGRGMNVLQITAFIPGRGEVNLLASPTIEGAEAVMTGSGADTGGKASLTMGGAFGVPWAGDLGPGAGNGEGTEWNAQPIPPIATKAGGSGLVLDDGLLLAAAADTSDSGALPDGGTAQAMFHEGSYGGRWTSKTDVSVNALLSSRAIELTVVATNVGDVTEPVGIGWSPRFAVSGADHAQTRLHLPAESRIEVRDRARNLPTGKLVPLAGGQNDFSVSGGASLSGAGIDEYYTDLQQKLLDNGPATDLINRAGGYGLRLTAMSPKMRAIHVVAPAQGNFISIDPQYNLPDPFGKEWNGDTNSGMVMLAPGQTTEWKVRLEIYAPGENDR
jgi:aldose 1-epimerase